MQIFSFTLSSSLVVMYLSFTNIFIICKGEFAMIFLDLGSDILVCQKSVVWMYVHCGEKFLVFYIVNYIIFRIDGLPIIRILTKFYVFTFVLYMHMISRATDYKFYS